MIESAKTNVGTRKLPLTEDVAECFRGIIEDREPRGENVIDGYSGFPFVDKSCNSLVAMHWEHCFNHMIKRYNEIYRVQMPIITPHACRRTYCSNIAKSGMSPKTLQYLMGHSDIGVTLNTYTHLGLEDAADGGFGNGEEGTGKGEGRKADVAENVLGNLIREWYGALLWRGFLYGK